MKTTKKQSPEKAPKTNMATEKVAESITENARFSSTAENIYSLANEVSDRLKSYRDKEQADLKNKVFDFRESINQVVDEYQKRDSFFILDDVLEPLLYSLRDIKDCYDRVWGYEREVVWVDTIADKVRPYLPEVPRLRPLDSSDSLDVKS